MTPDQTVILTRYVRALCPQQKFDEYTPDAWHDVLAPFHLDDCRTAASNLSGKQVFIAPAEIIAEVRRLRAERVANFVYDPPPGDHDPQYLPRLRGQLAAVASGQHPAPTNRPALDGGPHPDVAERLADIGRHIPDDVKRPGPLGVECPDCHAPIGRPCRTQLRNRPRRPHPARRTARDVPA